MADRTPLKTADRNVISDEDPFAELTRIMGFDPRQPVQARQDPVMADSDFDIDLEKELMGEFGLDADADVSPEQGVFQAQTANEPAHDLDEAVATSMRDFDLDMSGEAAQPAAPEIEFEGDFDDALTQSFDVEPQAQWPVEAENPVAAEPEVAEPVAAATHPEFDTRFEEAMADIDMDFDVSPEPVEEPQAAELLAGDDIAHEEIQEQQVAEPQIASASDPFDDAFSLDLDDAPVEAVAEETAPVAASAADKEQRSLEDELNALLGNMGARIPRPEATVMSRSWTATAQAAQAKKADPFAGAAIGYGAQLAQPQPAVADAGAEINAMLDKLVGSSTEPNPVENAAQAAASADDADIDLDFDIDDLETFSDEGEPEQVDAQAVSSEYSDAGQAAPVAYEESEEQAEQDDDAPAAYDDVPDVETVDVPERVIALADDLDLPELAFEEDRPATTGFDDLDHEFAGLLNDMSDKEAAPAPVRAAAYGDEPYQSGFSRNAGQGYAAAQPAYATARPAVAATVAAAAYDDDFDAAVAQDTRPFAPVEAFAAGDLDYDPDLDEAMAVPGLAAAESAQPGRRRGLLIAAVVAGVAVIGGIGAFALSPGGSGSGGAPVLVKADDKPTKVKPENPGGTVVPNQDNKVYDAVAKGVQPPAPEQQKLVANTQEPVDVNAAAPKNRVIDLSPEDDGDTAANSAVPTAKSEDRIDQNAQQAAADTASPETAVVTPRKVRTMVVKSDGSLVPREDPTPATPQVSAEEPADPAPQRVVNTTADQTGTVPPAAEQQAAVEKPAVKPVAKAKANTQSATTPATVAAVPQRPSDQPVDIVGEVKPDEVASISPTAAAAGSWSMQIASQPSVDSAQSSYKALARRYASVLDGHAVNIVKAEVAGKGTFYRVRVPANSRNDAIGLCESYKAAGGNCFVSK